MLATRFRRPWVLEVRDPWPDAAGIVGWLTEGSKLWRSLELLDRRLSQGADAIVIPTSGLLERTLRVGGKLIRAVPGAVLDTPPDERQRAAKRADLGLDPSTCLFVYTGAVGRANGLDTLVDAAKLMNGTADLAIAVVGDGSARADLGERIRNERVETIRLVGAVQKAEVSDWLAAGDVCLHLLRPDPRLECALPSKMLEYFGSHRPVLTTAAGLPQRMAEMSGGAFAGDASSLAAELERWAGMPASERLARGERSFGYGTSRFGREAVVDRLESLLEHVAATGRNGARSESSPVRSA